MNRQPPGVIGVRFWRRLLARHRRKAPLCRPRTGLVLRRTAAPPPAGRDFHPPRVSAAAALSLHLHLGWPSWLRAAPSVAATASRVMAARATLDRPRARVWESRPWPPRRLGDPIARVTRSGAPAVPALPAAAAAFSAAAAPIRRERSAGGSPARMTAGQVSARLSGSLSGSILRTMTATTRGTMPGGAAGRRHPDGVVRLVRRAGDHALVRTLVVSRLALGPVASAARAAASPARAASAVLDRAHHEVRRAWRRLAAGSRAPVALRARISFPQPPGPATLLGGPIPRLVQRHLPDASARAERPTLFRSLHVTWLQPAPRTLAQPIPAPAVAQPATPAPPPSAGGSRQPPPQIDLARLSEEVYRQIERRARIERERRGL